MKFYREHHHIIMVTWIFHMNMMTVHYLWEQKTRTTLGVNHENFHKFLMSFVRSAIDISSIPEWYAAAEQ
jgi:hypothetical protein